MGKIIVLASPVFLALIALEFWLSKTRGRHYGLADTINSISLGMLNQISTALGKLLTLGIYIAVYERLALLHAPDFWNTWYGFLAALVLYDFCYYWLHRCGHEIAIVWAAHVVHHQSQFYNLSTALRQTSSGIALAWIFYLPLALAGIPPTVFAIVALVDLLYQFWVHTELVGKLGWFDRVFCSPSNHRVHHAVNDRYIDRNYGGILMVWDHMFGSFQEETETCVYGTRSPLNSWDPLWANAEVYSALWQTSRRARQWGDKLLVWFKPPGWQSAAMALDAPKVPFALTSVQRFNVPLTPGQQRFAVAQFGLSMCAVSAYLWHAESMAWPAAWGFALALFGLVWLQGRYLHSKASAAVVVSAGLGLIAAAMLWRLA
jgi:sterol desaturase/sphingolipid hydroxylase (fatty acid hydroxylase superfamily)